MGAALLSPSRSCRNGGAHAYDKRKDAMDVERTACGVEAHAQSTREVGSSGGMVSVYDDSAHKGFLEEAVWGVPMLTDDGWDVQVGGGSEGEEDEGEEREDEEDGGEGAGVEKKDLVREEREGPMLRPSTRGSVSMPGTPPSVREQQQRIISGEDARAALSPRRFSARANGEQMPDADGKFRRGRQRESVRWGDDDILILSPRFLLPAEQQQQQHEVSAPMQGRIRVFTGKGGVFQDEVLVPEKKRFVQEKEKERCDGDKPRAALTAAEKHVNRGVPMPAPGASTQKLPIVPGLPLLSARQGPLSARGTVEVGKDRGRTLRERMPTSAREAREPVLTQLQLCEPEVRAPMLAWRGHGKVRRETGTAKGRERAKERVIGCEKPPKSSRQIPHPPPSARGLAVPTATSAKAASAGGQVPSFPRRATMQPLSVNAACIERTNSL